MDNNLAIKCPKCNFTTAKQSDTELWDLSCPLCYSTLFLKTCNSCGQENIGVYICHKCGSHLASIADASPETIFIEVEEADLILYEPVNPQQQIPSINTKTTINTSSVMNNSYAFYLFKLVYDKCFNSSHTQNKKERLITSQQQCNEILNEYADDLRPDALAMLRRLDVRPRVQITGDDTANVTILVFNMYDICNGFMWNKYSIKSNHVEQTDEEYIAKLMFSIQF